MTVRSPASWIQGGSHPAENDRNLLAALVGTPGIVGSADLAVTANGTPNMTVNVAAGAAFVKGTETTYQGMYHVFNDATVNLAIAASDPTNPRIDIVVAQVRDAFYSGASNDFRLVVVTGTPAGSPAAPATPADSIVLARVAVAALATTVVAGNITDNRVISSVVTAGSVTAASLSTGRILSTGAAPTAAAGAGGGTSPPAPVVVAGSTDTRGRITYGTGTAPPAGGIVVTVTFAVAYATAPIVVVSPTPQGTPSNTPSLSVGAVTTTTFQVSVAAALLPSLGNTTYGFNYIVIG